MQPNISVSQLGQHAQEVLKTVLPLLASGQKKVQREYGAGTEKRCLTFRPKENGLVQLTKTFPYSGHSPQNFLFAP